MDQGFKKNGGGQTKMAYTEVTKGDRPSQQWQHNLEDIYALETREE